MLRRLASWRQSDPTEKDVTPGMRLPDRLPPARTAPVDQAHREQADASLPLTLGLYAAAACMLVILALHLGLLTRGSWGGDEYKTIALYRDNGAGYLWFRFWSWSPRPVSELLIWLYAAAVVAFGQPLIVPALAVLWAATLAAALPALRRLTRADFAPRFLGAAAILVFVILGRRVEAVYYWPFGGVAYAPVIAALLYVLFSLSNEQAPARFGGTVCGLVLLAAAWSSEAGAFVVIILSALTIASHVWRHGLRPDRALAGWGALALASAAVIVRVLSNARESYPMLITGDVAIYHHTLASVWAAVARFPAEFLSRDGEIFTGSVLLNGAVAKLLFFLGVHACWAAGGPDRKRDRAGLLLFAVAVLLAMFGMLVASYRSFGGPCCEQHAFLRQSLGVIALAALAISLPPMAARVRRWRLIVAPMALSAAVAMMFAPRLADIKWDYRFHDAPARARARTWASGFAEGRSMTLYQPRPDLFPARIPAGVHGAADGWWAEGVLRFFGKDTVTVLIPAYDGHD